MSDLSRSIRATTPTPSSTKTTTTTSTGIPSPTRIKRTLQPPTGSSARRSVSTPKGMLSTSTLISGGGQSGGRSVSGTGGTTIGSSKASAGSIKKPVGRETSEQGEAKQARSTSAGSELRRAVRDSTGTTTSRHAGRNPLARSTSAAAPPLTPAHSFSGPSSGSTARRDPLQPSTSATATKSGSLQSTSSLKAPNSSLLSSRKPTVPFAAALTPIAAVRVRQVSRSGTSSTESGLKPPIALASPTTPRRISNSTSTPKAPATTKILPKRSTLSSTDISSISSPKVIPATPGTIRKRSESIKLSSSLNTPAPTALRRPLSISALPRRPASRTTSRAAKEDQDATQPIKVEESSSKPVRTIKGLRKSSSREVLNSNREVGIKENILPHRKRSLDLRRTSISNSLFLNSSLNDSTHSQPRRESWETLPPSTRPSLVNPTRPPPNARIRSISTSHPSSRKEEEYIAQEVESEINDRSWETEDFLRSTNERDPSLFASTLDQIPLQSSTTTIDDSVLDNSFSLSELIPDTHLCDSSSPPVPSTSLLQKSLQSSLKPDPTDKTESHRHQDLESKLSIAQFASRAAEEQLSVEIELVETLQSAKEVLVEEITIMKSRYAEASSRLESERIMFRLEREDWVRAAAKQKGKNDSFAKAQARAGFKLREGRDWEKAKGLYSTLEQLVRQEREVVRMEMESLDVFKNTLEVWEKSVGC